MTRKTKTTKKSLTLFHFKLQLKNHQEICKELTHKQLTKLTSDALSWNTKNKTLQKGKKRPAKYRLSMQKMGNVSEFCEKVNNVKLWDIPIPSSGATKNYSCLGALSKTFF